MFLLTGCVASQPFIDSFTVFPGGEKFILCIQQGKDSELGKFYFMQLDSQVLEEIGSDTISGTNPAISPNGRFLAFNHLRKGEPDRDISIFDIQNGTIKTISSTNRDEIYPFWSPDGKELFFIRGVPEYSRLHQRNKWIRYQIFKYSVEAEIESIVLKTKFSLILNPSIALDGKIIVFSGRKPGRPEVPKIYTVIFEENSDHVNGLYSTGIEGSSAVVKKDENYSDFRDFSFFYFKKGILKEGSKFDLHKSKSFFDDEEQITLMSGVNKNLVIDEISNSLFFLSDSKENNNYSLRQYDFDTGLVCTLFSIEEIQMNDI